MLRVCKSIILKIFHSYMPFLLNVFIQKTKPEQLSARKKENNEKGRKWTTLSHMTSSHPISLAGEDRTYRWTHPQLTVLWLYQSLNHLYLTCIPLAVHESKEESTNQLKYPFIKISWHEVSLLFYLAFNKKLKWRTRMVIWQTLWLFKHILSS